MAEVHGRYVYPDDLTPGNGRDGGLSQNLYDEHGALVNHGAFYPDSADAEVDDEVDDTESPSLAPALAGLALIGLTIGAVAAVSHVRTTRQQKRLERERRQQRTAVDQHGVSERARYTPPAGWYEFGDGRQRWWNGHSWTEHVRATPGTAVAASVVSLPVTSGAGSSSLLGAVEMVNTQPTISMTRVEWEKQVRAMLLARMFSEEQWRLLSLARIEDADRELLEWQNELRQLTPQQFSDRIRRAIDVQHSPQLQNQVPAGWYDDGSSRLRWWDGQRWTAHVHEDRLPLPSSITTTPAGWYHDGYGHLRWWDGQLWTNHTSHQ